MKLDYYTPSDSCRSLIVQYEHVRAAGENISVVDRHIPSGYASWVFNLSGSATVNEESIIKLPPYFMVMPLFRAVKIGIYGELDSFIITCRTSVLSRLLSLDFSDAPANYHRCLEGKVYQTIERDLAAHKLAEPRIASIERFFREQGVTAYVPDEIDQLYDLILEGQGCVPIASQIEQFEHSPRYLRQHFIQRVGLNAKTLARIVRVNHLWSMILKNQAVDFQNMVFEGNYFDQAHLIHDFKYIVGETPSCFFRRNLDNVRIISGKV